METDVQYLHDLALMPGNSKEKWKPVRLESIYPYQYPYQ